ncbi:R-phenyllactate dehydratase activator [bacterium BMS3Abin07]|nr:R-phenyllactate dehydratase activator [bacterium BMS3Abin07]GBE32767.1 R-phenyllactate dehydratase activator [bacterium BMS3Bbin05]HDL21319.1 2-hydroxyglutaryl-CoA dehydratase [Nitrospirota bacterium]HDO22382.1 2-hydroxyglutaryl-CoA dehydratase [Nitrospirota bacterium]HDZ87575.1 2-hydroxyglutaryl-CoA dehydratase [Nitrospirota bacterium]
MLEGFLGIDVGSVTTKLALIDKNDDVIWSTYRKTKGQPIRVLQSALRDLSRALNPVILGLGTTGSGRRLASYLAGADIVKNEITAHAVASIETVPEVRTIMEIGGQDSKLIIIRDGVVIDFSMNTVCAAGTGSFLEHQASRLGLSVEELGGYAISSTKPTRIAGRCTVFAESDMVHKQQMGHEIEDIVSGLCDALCRNYLSNLARGKELRDPVIFQGGVAANEGIKSSFERELNKEIIIPEHFNIMGAIGAAMLARELSPKETRFRGFSIAHQQLTTSSFYCNDCHNSCGIIEIRDGENIIARWGDSCSKWSAEFEKVSN